MPKVVLTGADGEVRELEAETDALDGLQVKVAPQDE